MKHFNHNSIIINLPTGVGQIVDITEWGAKAENGFCNTLALERAIAYCHNKPEATLLIPKGVYHFYRTDLSYFIGLHHLNNFTIEGSGSEFIFHQAKDFIDIKFSKRLMIKNLILDWNWNAGALASVGVIKEVGKKGSYLDIQFPGYDVIDSNMDIRIVGPFDSKRYTPGAEGGIEFRPYQNQHIKGTNNEESNKEMVELVRELDNILEKRTERVNENTLRMFPQEPSWAATHFNVGDCYNFRHFEYDCEAIRTTKSSHITFERVTIYGCPGGGFLNVGSVHHLHFSHCKIQPRPGTFRSISVSVDCLHVGNSKGYIIIEDCDFSGAGDDCVNLHDNSSMGVTKINDYTILLERVSEDKLQFEIGGYIEIRTPDLSPTGYWSRITNVQYFPEKNNCQLQLALPLPSNLVKDCIIFNRSYGTDYYIIRNCRFTNNRARGLLLQGSHGIVEHNTFENIQGAAIQIETGSESRWSEGQGVTDLLIQHNTIRHCDLNAWQMAVVYMGVYLPKGRTIYPIFKDIEIAHNTIVDFPRLACFLSSCENVWVHDNALINGEQRDYSCADYGSSTMELPIYNEKYEGVIQFSHSKNCLAENNHIFNTMLN